MGWGLILECLFFFVKSCCNFGGDINVGEYVLDVIEIFESIKDFVKFVGVFKFDMLGEVWFEWYFSGVVINIGILDGFMDINNSVWIWNNFKDFVFINDVFRFSVDGCFYELVFIYFMGFCFVVFFNFVGFWDWDNIFVLE